MGGLSAKTVTIRNSVLLEIGIVLLFCFVVKLSDAELVHTSYTMGVIVTLYWVNGSKLLNETFVLFAIVS